MDETMHLFPRRIETRRSVVEHLLDMFFTPRKKKLEEIPTKTASNCTLYASRIEKCPLSYHIHPATLAGRSQTPSTSLSKYNIVPSSNYPGPLYSQRPRWTRATAPVDLNVRTHDRRSGRTHSRSNLQLPHCTLHALQRCALLD